MQGELAELMPGVGLGVVLGFLIASLGGGGGLFLVPLFVLLFKEPVTRATGNAMVVIFSAALVGALRHWRGGRVHFKVGGLVAIGQMLGGLIGALLNPRVPPNVVLGVLIAVLLGAAIYMTLGKPVEQGAEQLRPARLLSIGLGVGTLSGFAGVGGGFLMVPALIWGAGLSLTVAIGTSVAIMTLGSLVSGCAYLWQGAISVRLAGAVGAGAMVGALLGAAVSGKLPERPVRLVFSAMMVVAAVLLLSR